MTKVVLLVLLAALDIVSVVIAAETNCPEHFVGGKAPDLLSPKLSVMAREVCYKGYAVLHSGVTRTPVYAAEHLTRERLLQAKGLKRKNNFHPDENIPKSERAELKHYANSGYDRGHMAPSANMSDELSQYESFSLANMVPQNPNNNRGVWAQIETEVRLMALELGALYVISGPLFDDEPTIINAKVSIPAKLFKIVFNEQGSFVRGYLVTNTTEADSQFFSQQQIEQIAALSFVLPQAK